MESCDVDKNQKISEDYNLKVIYDAAHAFGVQCHCGSLLNHGDASIVSFYATKVYNTFESGAVITPDKSSLHKINKLKNFGFINQESVGSFGLNAKLSEIHAAVGLCNLESIGSDIYEQKNAHLYAELLESNVYVDVVDTSWIKKYNYSYYPITLSSSICKNIRDTVFERLKKKIFFQENTFIH